MKKILIIDDDESTRESLTSYLSEIGYELYDAENGLKGLESIKLNFPDLIISDIRMSGVDGIELTYILKGLCYNIPIILISSYDNIEIKAVKKYIHSFLQKPLSIKELKTKILQALIK